MIAVTAPPIRDVVVLDIDDTLYLERTYVASGFRAVGAFVAREMGMAGFADDAWRLFEAGVRDRIFDRVLAARGMMATATMMARLVGVYRGHAPDIRLAEDARRFMERQPQGRGLAILSDGFLVGQRAKVRALGLDRKPIFPLILTDEMGRAYWKPHMLGFQHIQDHFGLPSSCFVYVADNPSKDFAAPSRLGWRTVRVRRSGGLHQAISCAPPTDIEVSTFDSLSDDVLDHLFGR